MDYIGNTDADNKDMLQALGIASTEDLLKDIPQDKIIRHCLALPPAGSELEVKKQLREVAGQNASVADFSCFLGAGAYDHYIPSTVPVITKRGEFYTAYTPYQPEISQGTLQSIFEYQTMICNLTGMDVANASLYDGATALYEAIHLACEHTQRNIVLVAKAIHPEYRQVVHTYLKNSRISIKEIPFIEGLIDLAALKSQLNDQVAAVVVQQPNFFGCLEHVQQLGAMAHKQGALFVTSIYPVSLGVLQKPAEYGADIVTGEGQSLGLPVSFGGPYLGIFACRQEFMRKMPGRIVGESIDNRGQRAYVLTLQTREQHIPRERATSNICSNEALCALSACVYLSSMGAAGLKDVATASLSGAHYLAAAVARIPGWKINFKTAFFNEFVATAPGNIEALNKKLLRKNIIGGLPLKKYYPELKKSLLFCVTEKRTKAEIDTLVRILKEKN
ncbi:MAG: aminomethyl-transferring glycine dehydrogenase subunit GcvPA [bacterium]|nr:aminomethyl-transferring glycine dehydrogenase subunit GcvPA [bacterium]